MTSKKHSKVRHSYLSSICIIAHLLAALITQLKHLTHNNTSSNALAVRNIKAHLKCIVKSFWHVGIFISEFALFTITLTLKLYLMHCIGALAM